MFDVAVALVAALAGGIASIAGFGIGSLLFGEALHLGFGLALAIFASIQLIAAIAAFPLFRSETASRVSISLAEDKLQAAPRADQRG